jgi:hypothetical protein
MWEGEKYDRESSLISILSPGCKAKQKNDYDRKVAIV